MTEAAEALEPVLLQEPGDRREAGTEDGGTDAAGSAQSMATGEDTLPAADGEPKVLRSVWDGQRLETYTWTPKEMPPRLILYLCHGAGEHMGRYEKLRDVLVENGILVYGHDHVGHGRSEGVRLHVNSFDTYVLDVVQHVERMRGQYPDIPSLIMGHSMVQ